MSEQGLPDSLTEFIDRVETTEWSVRIVNRTEPEPVRRMLDDLFGGLSIDTEETEQTEAADDRLLLFHEGEVVASSPLSAVKESLLLVNSDLYRTGATDIEEIDPPDVIVELSDTVFSLRGYPESSVEKLVLTLISRYIEYRAWTERDGELRTSFQRLSRLDDESGTREIYDRLGRLAGIDVHVFGFPDWNPAESMDVTVHGVDDDEILRHWFVVYDGDDGRSVAMLAVKTGSSEWEGFWTFEAGRIEAISEYVSRTFGSR